MHFPMGGFPTVAAAGLTGGAGGGDGRLADADAAVVGRDGAVYQHLEPVAPQSCSRPALTVWRSGTRRRSGRRWTGSSWRPGRRRRPRRRRRCPRGRRRRSPAAAAPRRDRPPRPPPSAWVRSPARRPGMTGPWGRGPRRRVAPGRPAPRARWPPGPRSSPNAVATIAPTASNSRPTLVVTGIDSLEPPRRATRVSSAPVQAAAQVGGDRRPATVEQPGHGHAPRLTDGGRPAGQDHGGQMAHPLESVEVGDEELAAPQGAVGPEAQPVEGDARGPVRCGRGRPGTRPRGRGGAERRTAGRSSSAASLVERYSGWRSWATTSGVTP